MRATFPKYGPVLAGLISVLFLLAPGAVSAQCITVLVNGVHNPPHSTSNLRVAQDIVNAQGCSGGGLNTILVQTATHTEIGTGSFRVIINRPTHIRGLHGGERHRIRSINENALIPVEVNARAIIEDVNVDAGSYLHQGGIVVNAGGSDSELRGVRVSGSRAAFSSGFGILINGASGVLIAPSDPFPVEIVGNFSGINIVNGAVNTTIRGAHIGITASGNAGSNRNTDWGITIQDSTAVNIGGLRSNSAHRNIIANNGLGAIRISNSTLVNIQGNHVGVRADGISLSRNGWRDTSELHGGIRVVNSSLVSIGDSSPGRGNLLLADPAGMTLVGSDAVFVRDNIIGVRLDGQPASFGTSISPPVLVNADSGHAGTIQIGGIGTQANLIRRGGGYAVRIEPGAGRVDVRRNSISGSAGPGTGAIDREPPPAPPVLTFVNPATGAVQGSVTPVPAAGEVDVFMDAGNMAEHYLGTVALPANASTFSLTLTPAVLQTGQNLTASFTRLDGAGAGTSALSAPLPIVEVTHHLSVLRNGQGSVSSVPAGIDCGSNCAAQYAYGTPVTLTAAAAPGWSFVGWGGAGGACTGTSPTCLVHMNLDRIASASFAEILPDTHTLVVQIGGTGSGTVTSMPPGMNCSSGSCQAEFDEGTQVTLNVQEGADSEFEDWSGACSGSGGCTVSMSQDRIVGAAFADTTVQRTLEVLKIGNGFVFSTGAGGINCGATCSAQINEGTVVNLNTNDGAFGWRFSHWEGGPCQGVSAASCPVTMDQDHVITAVYLPDIQKSLTVVRHGAGTVSSEPEGIVCGGVCGAEFEEGTAIALTATASPGWQFVQWSGDACNGQSSPECLFDLDDHAEITATFSEVQVRHPLTVEVGDAGRVNSDPDGIQCPSSSCYALFDHDTTVQLTALIPVGWQFAGWTEGPCEGSTNTVCAFTMDDAVHAAITATPVTRTLVVDHAGSGAGTVTSAPAGIACGDDCLAGYDHGTPVTLTAVPASGSVFGGWSGDCTGAEECFVTMNADRAATATFISEKMDSHELAVLITGNGQVASSPLGIDCPSGTCQADFLEGQTVVLSAVADDGWVFSHWSGTDLCAGQSDPQCPVFMDQPYHMQAVFVESSGGQDVIFQERFQSAGGPP